MPMIVHRPVRMFFKPWRVRCACGWPYYPCFNVQPLGVQVTPLNGQISDRLRKRHNGGWWI